MLYTTSQVIVAEGVLLHFDLGFWGRNFSGEKVFEVLRVFRVFDRDVKIIYKSGSGLDTTYTFDYQFIVSKSSEARLSDFMFAEFLHF